MKQAIYEEGYNDYHRLLAVQDCPYHMYSSESEYWIDGWIDAQRGQEDAANDDY